MFASTVTSLLRRIEVSNLSGVWKFKGDLPCQRCLCLWHLVCGVFSCQAHCVQKCTHTGADTHSLSPSLKFPDAGDFPTTFIHLSIVEKDPVLHKMAQITAIMMLLLCLLLFSLNLCWSASCVFNFVSYVWKERADKAGERLWKM